MSDDDDYNDDLWVYYWKASTLNIFKMFFKIYDEK